MDLIELKTKTRTGTGKGAARKLRQEGRVPAVLYGPNSEPTLLSVSAYDLEQSLKKGTKGQMLLDLVVENGSTSNHMAMIKELQVHPLSRNFVHVDFYKVAMDRKIRVMVPVVTTGKSIGVELGGILQIIRRELEVLCYPSEIPKSIELDITDLNMGESIHVNDIPTEGNIEIPAEVNFTVITILTTKGKDEEVDEEGLEEEEAGEETEAPAE